jgi:phosphopantothenoylcysteine decarboxylase / phosphopantothenate---cysteine ligase
VLKGKSILLGITGSVAAYKAIDLIKGLKNEEASVSVIMTEASKHFVTPMSIEIAASPGPVVFDMFESRLAHIDRPRNADLFIVAPATANTLSKYASGIADNLLNAALLAFEGKVIVAPAMNWRMWQNPMFQKNMRLLDSAGVITVGPDTGALACGEEGPGRMAGIEKIVEAAQKVFTPQDLAGQHVLITAGPTRERIDPVRFISNRSSGKMGYALAKIARRKGAAVTLISGPTALCAPDGVETISVESAIEMRRQVMDRIGGSSVFIMCAAVADFAPAAAATEKISKSDLQRLNLKLNPDILSEVSTLPDRPFTVGFSAETGPDIDRARRKMADKKAHMFIFNNVTSEGAGFDVDTNEVTIIDSRGQTALPVMKKEDVAAAILDRIITVSGGG